MPRPAPRSPARFPLPPRRRALGAALGAVLLLTAAAPAFAHGGTYRGPGGAIQPGARPPGDPTPPPPPPPTGEPPVTPDPTGGPGRGPSTPGDPGPLPPTPGTPVTPDLGGAGRGAATPPGYEDWTFWYHHNKEGIENLKRELYTRVDSRNPMWVMGSEHVGNATGTTQATRVRVESDLIPALLWAMDPKNAGHQDTESAAYIALAKVTRDPAHVRLLARGLDKGHNPLVVESAALALGLLRRESPGQQLGAAELDRVPALLVATFEDERHRTRVRAFAALALGLLGDQPTGSGGTDAAAAAAALTARLFGWLEQRHAASDLPCAALLAIGMQPATSIRDPQREILRHLVARGRVGGREVPGLVASYAALALGRIGEVRDVAVLTHALTPRRGRDRHVQRSAAIGLGRLGRRVAGPERVAVARTLLGAAERARDASTANFALISLAYLVCADVEAARTEVVEDTRAPEALLRLAAEGRPLTRPFAALALGLIGRAIGEDTTLPVYGDLRVRAVGALRAGLADRGAGRARAACATALGILRDREAEGLRRLAEIVRSEREDDELRAYAALALGLIDVPAPEVVTAVRAALQERGSEVLRMHCATALGLLGDRKALPLLEAELDGGGSLGARGEALLAIARVGDDRAVDPLIARLKDPAENAYTRALACAGLGIVGDLEWVPSLARLSQDLNYRASPDAINEVVTIL